MVWDWISQDYVPELIDSFVNPQKRVSATYLLLAFILGLAWSVKVSQGTWRQGLAIGVKNIFARNIWFSASATADYKLMLINRAIMLLVVPALVSKIAVTTFLYFWLIENFSASAAGLSTTPIWLVSVFYTVFIFVFDDFSRFGVHLALHRVPALWSFHKTHHTAETLTPFTVYRTHPVEGILFSLRSVLVHATTISLFVFLFGGKVDLVTLYGVNILLFIFNATGSNLRHSHIQIRYGWMLEHFLISPAQHQIHHSIDPDHRGKNFGAALAIWDWMFSSLYIAQDRMILKFGLTNTPQFGAHSLVSLYFSPFYEISLRFCRALRRGFKRLNMNSIFPINIGRIAKFTFIPLATFAALAGLSVKANSDELNVYSHRQPFLIKPFLREFEKQFGIKGNVVFASKGLVQRLQAEGSRSPADEVLTVDIGRLYAYADKKLFAQVRSNILESNIPSHLRDKDNHWFGLSKRARIVAIARDRVKVSDIERIEDLAKPKWKGRVCSRPGSHVYNRALLASIIAAHGKKAAEDWARGLVSNLARRPQGNDRAQVKAIYEGVCDVAIINSYYYGKLKASKIPAQREWAKAIRIVFTNQKDRGNHVNISGGGVARYSKNKGMAIKLLEFLTSKTAQKLYGQINYEFPINPSADASAEVRSWGSFREDALPIGTIATLAPVAQRIIDRVEW